MTAERVRLVAPVYAAATPAGTRMLTHRGPLSLSASSFAMWFDKLAPALDGRRSLTELTGPLPADRAAMVERVVRLLIDRGLAREEDARRDAEAPGADPLTGFADAFVGEAVRRVAAWRASEIMIVGAGDLLLAAVRAVCRTGIRRVRAAVTDEEATDLDAVRGLARRTELFQDADPAAPGSADLVVHVGGGPGLDGLRRVERDCDRRGVPLAQARLLGDGIWLACPPPGQAARRGLGSAARRIEAMSGRPAEFRDAGPPISDLAATVAAATLIHQFFRTVACDAPATGPTVIDLVTLAAQRCRVLPHPFDAPLRSRAADRPVPDPDASVLGQDEETFSRLAIAAVDPAAGLIGELSEADLCQAPLHVCRVRVGDPVGLLGSAAPRPVTTGAGLDFATARRRAARRALAAYGSLMVDPRRLTGPGGNPLVGADPDRLLLRLLGGEPARLTGRRLDDRRIVEVDAAAAFPALLGSSRPYTVPVGVAAGPDWEAAVCRGLLSHCRELVVSDIRRMAAAPRRVDVEGFEAGMLDPVGERYLRILAALGAPVEVYDLGVFAAVPSFAFCLAGRTVAYHCGRSVAEAVRQGLESLLLDHQSRSCGQPEYRPDPVPPLPRADLAAHDPAAVAGRPPAGPADLVAALTGRGLVPVAVPLDHDPELAGILPGLVHVVVTDG